MKTITFLLFGFLLTMNTYEKIMLENIRQIYEASSVEAYRESANAFDRIAARETDKWEPLYYSAYGYLMMAGLSQENDPKDQYLDLAMERVKKGLEIAPEESELVTLEGFAYMLRVTVDPMNRGPKFSPMAIQTFQKAISLNPDNPRAHFMLGQMELGTARFFNSDTSGPCTKIQQSVEMFEVESAEESLMPSWGKSWAEGAAEHCKG